eukprot:SAG31_NODE_20015_length_586_cov_0.796715_1_plen_26_part_10
MDLLRALDCVLGDFGRYAFEDNMVVV